MAANHYQRGEFFRRHQIKQLENPEVDSSRDNLEPDSQDNQREACPNQQLRSEEVSSSSDQSLNCLTKSAKKTNDKTPKVRSWTPERVELLLKYLKEYKVICDFNGKDNICQQCIQIRRCLSIDFKPHPTSPGGRP